MKHIALTRTYLQSIPDWAMQNRHRITEADFETAVYANLGMPVEPEYYAEQETGGVRQVVAWRGKHITAVKAVVQ
jgi:hypothetical protein